MPFIDEHLKSELSELFSKELKNEVKIWLFTSKHKEVCQYCDEVVELVTELSSLTNRFKIFTYDIDEHPTEAKVLGVDKVPAILINGSMSRGIYYYGIPTGYEFNSLVDDLIDVSNGKSKLSENAKAAVRKIDKKVDIKVFVTPTCPYCPRAVRMAHQIALENSNVKASMIEATEFRELSEMYGVMSVPKVVINDTVSFEGALPEKEFINYINKALNKN